MLGGAYNFTGPPVVLYGTMRAWTPAEFRSSLQGFFVPLGVVIVLGHVLGGLWSTPRTLELTLLSLPAAGAGLILGSALARRVDPARFRHALHLLLILLGVVLLWR